jgi:hypothetical protein
MSVRTQSAEKGYLLRDAWFDSNAATVAYLDMNELAAGRGASATAYCLAGGLNIDNEANRANFHKTGIYVSSVKSQTDNQIWLQLQGEAIPSLWSVLALGIIHPLSVRRIYTYYGGIASNLRGVRVVGYGVAGCFAG